MMGRVQEGFAMNNWFIIAAVAFLLFPARFDNANAAGAYDGEWKGTATSVGGRCKRASVDFTVKGQVVLGQAKFDGGASNINGTVNQSGAMGATIGFQFLKGQFSADEFQGTFKVQDCQWEAILKRTPIGNRDGEDRNQAVSSQLRGR
jgi:hypothetical protein